MRKITFVNALLVATAIALPTFAFAADGSDRGTSAGVIQSVSARSTVTAIGQDWLTIANGTDTLTFEVTSKTRVIGRGLATMAREKERTGGGPTISDTVGLNDQVIVSYKDVDGKLTAIEVRLLAKGR